MTNYDALRMPSNRLHNHTTDSFTFHPYPQTATNSTAIANQQNAINSAKSIKKFSILQAFVPSFIIVIVVLVATTVFILESHSDYFVTLKTVPEMMNLNYQYYQPFKDFLFRSLRLKKWDRHGWGGIDRDMIRAFGEPGLNAWLYVVECKRKCDTAQCKTRILNIFDTNSAQTIICSAFANAVHHEYTGKIGAQTQIGATNEI